MTSPSPAPLTPVEQAAASEVQNFCWHTGPSTDPASLCGECDKVARAVVAAVRKSIATDVEIETLENYAAILRCCIQDDDYAESAEIFVDEKHIEGMERTARQLDYWAEKLRLSLPASKETPDAR